MRFCKYCGGQIEDEAKICPHCGKELKKVIKELPDEANRPGKVNKTVVNAKALAVIAAVILAGGIAILTMGGRCKWSGCNNKAAPGSSYCYSHKCVVSNCKNKRGLYSNYCYEHSYYDEDEADSHELGAHAAPEADDHDEEHREQRQDYLVGQAEGAASERQSCVQEGEKMDDERVP